MVPLKMLLLLISDTFCSCLDLVVEIWEWRKFIENFDVFMYVSLKREHKASHEGCIVQIKIAIHDTVRTDEHCLVYTYNKEPFSYD